MRRFVSTVSCVLLLGACGDDAPPGDPDGGTDARVAGNDGGADAGEGPDAGDGCIEATVESFYLDGYDDVVVRYGARIRPDIGGQPFHLYIESRRYTDVPFVGTFELGTGADGNYGTCAHCVIAFYATTYDHGYFASAGTLTLGQDPYDLAVDAVLDGVELIEVTIGEDLTSTPVPDGECIRLAHAEVDQTFGPPGWTCDVDEFEDGAECDCECGILDRDCVGTALPIDGCAPTQLCLPLARGVIGPFFGASVCANDCDRATGVTCPSPEVCVSNAIGDVCIAEPSEIDRLAPLGAVCAEGALYCAIDASGNSNGYCDLFSRADRRCQPRCSADDECDTASFERCYIVGGDASSGVEVPFGYCALPFPPEWTCSGAGFEDGAACHCGCGAADPDCFDLALPVMGCAAGEVCMDGATCSPP